MIPSAGATVSLAGFQSKIFEICGRLPQEELLDASFECMTSFGRVWASETLTHYADFSLPHFSQAGSSECLIAWQTLHSSNSFVAQLGHVYGCSASVLDDGGMCNFRMLRRLQNMYFSGPRRIG